MDHIFYRSANLIALGYSNYEGGWFNDAIRSLFSLFDKVAYLLLQIIYQLFFNVTSSDIFSTGTIIKFYSRMQLIIGVFMMFQLALTILKGIMNPDDFTNAKTGGWAVIMRIVISLVMLTVLVPISVPSSNPNEFEKQINNHGLLFGTLYSLQHRILANNTLGRLILGTNDSSSFSVDSESLKTSARIFTSTIVKGFYRINLIPEDSPDYKHVDGKDDAIYNENRVCQDIDDEVLADYTRIDADPLKIISYVNEKCDNDKSFFPSAIKSLLGKEKYVFAYLPVISSIVGFVFVAILLSFTVDVAVRAVKLSVLRLIAPIPIISYMNPKGNGDNAFNAWVKVLTSTYLDLFIRLAVVYFVIFLIQDMIFNGIVIDRADGLVGIFSMILIWIGLFIFAKQAPKFIREALGMKGEGGKLFGGWGELKALGAAGLGAIGSGFASGRARSFENQWADSEKGRKSNKVLNAGKTAASAIGGGFSGLFTGARAFAAKDATARSVIDAQNSRNARRAAHSTFLGRMTGDLYDMVQGRSLAEKDQFILDSNATAAKSLGDWKDKLKEQAIKNGAFGKITVKDADGNDRERRFNVARLKAAMNAKDTRGNFKYTDTDGNTTEYNVREFTDLVMEDLTNSQAKLWMSSTKENDTNVAFGKKSYEEVALNEGGKLYDVHQQTIYDLAQVGGKAFDIDDPDNYSDYGPKIGKLNAKKAEMSTSLRAVKHRANSRKK